MYIRRAVHTQVRVPTDPVERQRFVSDLAGSGHTRNQIERIIANGVVSYVRFEVEEVNPTNS